MKSSYLTVLVFASTIVGQTVFQSGLNAGKCLDLFFNTQENGAPIVIYDCNGSDAQKWHPEPTGPTIELYANTTLCLDAGANPAFGSHIHVGPCNPDSAGQHFLAIGNPHYIQLGNTGLCIGTTNGNTTNLDPLELVFCTNVPDDIWNPV